MKFHPFHKNLNYTLITEKLHSTLTIREMSSETIITQCHKQFKVIDSISIS